MLRLPPQDIETEKAVLGALMVDPNAIIKVADFLAASDFYKPTHQKIYETIFELFSNSQPIDLLSVSTKLKEKNWLAEIGDVNHFSFEGDSAYPLGLSFLEGFYNLSSILDFTL